MEQSLVDKIIGAALGVFIGWLLVRSVAWLILRSRFKNYLCITLNIHFAHTRDCQRWLSHMINESLQPKQPLQVASLYTPDTLTDLTSIRERAIELLSKRETTLLTKCIRAFWEIEALLDGFCADLRKLHQAKTPLQPDDIHHLKARAKRIDSLIALLPQSIETLNKLPEDYSGRTPPDAIMPAPTQAVAKKRGGTGNNA